MNKIINFEIETKTTTTFEGKVTTIESIKLYLDGGASILLEKASAVFINRNGEGISISSGALIKKLNDYIYNEEPLYFTAHKEESRFCITSEDECVLAISYLTQKNICDIIKERI